MGIPQDMMSYSLLLQPVSASGGDSRNPPGYDAVLPCPECLPGPQGGYGPDSHLPRW